MSAQHTPGRMTFRENGEANSYALLDDLGNWWMSALLNGEQITERQIANMRRIVACWNACDGISTESLESEGSAAMGWARTASKLIHATKQRDELLSALDYALGCIERGDTSDMQPVRDAIAKVKGGAA